MSPIFGLYYYSSDNRVISLPLQNVRAEANIKELAAQVKLTQAYVNDAAFPIEATYSFPIPARAAVCSFVMVKQDGTRVVGSVLEKQEARETYNTAVAQGQQASLLEQHTPDVFQVSVGNIPSNEQVQIELIYATELSEDEENDSIRFHVPIHIGARYGQAPQSTSTPAFSNVFISSSSSAPFLTIDISVEAIAPIAKIGSPSHTVSTELGPDPKLPNFKELPFSNYARVSLSSDSVLDKDFVLTVKSTGLDTPRCVAEFHPTHDTVALGLTLVPRFKLPDLARQEFICLVDRSGSMDGARIAAARKALVVMLRSLPHKDSLFQITSFGSRARALWADGSRPYNQETLEAATRHVDGMTADYGGTEIRGALEQCFAARKRHLPTSLFVLTDGEAWDLDAVFDAVKKAVAVAPPNAPLRVSVLGIGDSVSTAMCEGIARVGRGTCMFVGEQETSFTGKIARLLKAARTPPTSNISVDWGRPLAEDGKAATQPEDDFEMVERDTVAPKKSLNIFDEDVDPLHVEYKQAPPPTSVSLPPFPAVQQSPFTIRNLFPGVRLNIYAILQGKTIPETVTLRGSTADGAEIELPIPVTLSHLQHDSAAPPALHALAARKIIQDLEDGQHGLVVANPDDADLLARTVKASVVRLGTTYSISSTHTSFVAVDEGAPLPPHVAIVMRQREPVQFCVRAGPIFRSRRPSTRGSVPPPPPSAGAPPPPPPAPGPPPSGGAPPHAPRYRTSAHDYSAYDYGAISSLVMTTPRASIAPPSPASAMVPSAYQSQAPSSQAYTRFAAQAPAPQVHTRFADSAPAAQASPMRANETSFGSVARCKKRAVVDDDDEEEEEADEPEGSPALPTDPLEALARMQSFDGRFSLDVFEFVTLSTDLEAVRALFPAGADDTVVATVLAMAFLSTKLGANVERDSWEGMYEKAKDYVQEAMGVDASAVERLEGEAGNMLA